MAQFELRSLAILQDNERGGFNRKADGNEKSTAADPKGIPESQIRLLQSPQGEVWKLATDPHRRPQTFWPNDMFGQKMSSRFAG